MTAAARIVGGHFDLVGTVVGAHREHAHLVAVGVSQARAIWRPGGHVTGERTLALVLVCQTLGHLDEPGAVAIDGPQVQYAFLINIEAQSSAVRAPRRETGEGIQAGDLRARPGGEIDDRNFSLQLAAGVDRQSLAIRAPRRMTIVKVALADEPPIGSVGGHGVYVVRIVPAGLESDVRAIRAPRRPD